MVPPGVSKKTGRPYATFCPEAKNHGVKTIQLEKEGPDWDAIAVGKTASLFVAAQLQAGKAIEDISVAKSIKLANEVVEGTRNG